MAGEGDAGPSSGRGKNNSNNGNDLLLYYFPSSYCSQKVVFALHEKKLHFKSHIVDILKGEQFEPWFMKLNPEAMVPVLKDNGVKVIPDSARIIDYLEDNFSNGDTPRLMPEKGTEEAQKLKQMRDLLDSVPYEMLTFGSYFHPEMTKNSKVTPCELKLRTGKFALHTQLLDDYSVKYPDQADLYKKKKESLQNTLANLQDIKEFTKALDDVEKILEKVEEEFSSHSNDKTNWWLCAEKFTIADISLAVLLHRIKYVGLWERYFAEGKHPHLLEFYKRVQQREAFKKTFNQHPGLLSSFCCRGLERKALFTISGIATVLGVAIIVAVLYRRNK